MQNNYVVIMAGGIGTRFWPYSRTQKPKQFLDVMGTGSSLLQLTYQRFKSICPLENVFVVTHESYKDLVKEQLPELSDNQILLEPTRRNTAPCIAYACYKIGAKNPKANIVVTPSDHIILKESPFISAIEKAIQFSEKEDCLITLGITPNRPETGYGYIQFDHLVEDDVFKVKTFTEKPQLDLAIKFLDSGEFVWNAGIFIWSASSILSAFGKHLPDLAEIFENGDGIYNTNKEDDFIKQAYSQCKNVSIDYGIMEKADNVFMVKGDFGWSDLGTWNSLYEIREKDENANVIQGNVITVDSKNCYIIGPKDNLILTQGLEGYLVAQCDNVLLICEKDKESQFRDFINVVKDNKGNEYL
jgi:mannose-1-phosphate guanylyltransferase